MGVLENGTGLGWFWLELGADILQPSLLVLGMTMLPFDLKWWGNTTLGAYCFHFYFRDQITAWTLSLSQALKWDQTGLLLFFAVVSIAFFMTTFLGPAGHYVLLAPTLLYARISRILVNRRRVAVRELRPDS